MSKEATAETKPKKKRSKVKMIVLIVILAIVAVIAVSVVVSVVESLPPKESTFKFIKVEGGYEVKFAPSREDNGTGDRRIDVVVPAEHDGKPVVGIADGAFIGIYTLNSVTIPENVTYIGKYAFENCENLAYVTIMGNGLQTVKEEAFLECHSLYSIELPDSVESVGRQAFYRCTKLASIVFPAKVTKIEFATFLDCRILTNFTAKGAIESIGEYAFRSCTKLEFPTMEFAEGATVADNAFEGCTTLQKDPRFKPWLSQVK